MLTLSGSIADGSLSANDGVTMTGNLVLSSGIMPRPRLTSGCMRHFFNSLGGSKVDPALNDSPWTTSPVSQRIMRSKSSDIFGLFAAAREGDRQAQNAMRAATRRRAPVNRLARVGIMSVLGL